MAILTSCGWSVSCVVWLINMLVPAKIRRRTLRQWLKLVLTYATSGAVLYLAYKGLTRYFETDSPLVVVISGSMEPTLSRGDLLLISNRSHGEVKLGDIIVFKVKRRAIPIVHRVIQTRAPQEGGAAHILTKGDANPADDRILYAQGQRWLTKEDVIGSVVGSFCWVGYMRIWFDEYPRLKYAAFLLTALYCLYGDDDDDDDE